MNLKEQNFGHITEVVTAAFFSELFENINFEERKLNDSFNRNTSTEVMLQNFRQGKYKIGSSASVRKVKNLKGDDVTVVLNLVANVNAKHFIENFNAYEIHHQAVEAILESLNIGTFAKTLFIQRSSPYKEIHDVITQVQNCLKNGITEYIIISISTVGDQTGSRFQAPRISSKTTYVPKSDIQIKLRVTEKKTNKITVEVTKNFSIKGNSQTIESTSLTAMLNMIYNLANNPPKVLTEYYQPTLRLSRKRLSSVEARERDALFSEINSKLKTLGRIECSKENAATMFKGLVGGSDLSVYFKVEKGIKTIDVNSLVKRIRASKRVFIDVETNSTLDVIFEDISSSKHLLFKFRSRSNGIEININKNLYAL